MLLIRFLFFLLHPHPFSSFPGTAVAAGEPIVPNPIQVTTEPTSPILTVPSGAAVEGLNGVKVEGLNGAAVEGLNGNESELSKGKAVKKVKKKIVKKKSCDSSQDSNALNSSGNSSEVTESGAKKSGTENSANCDLNSQPNQGPPSSSSSSSSSVEIRVPLGNTSFPAQNNAPVDTSASFVLVGKGKKEFCSQLPSRKREAVEEEVPIGVEKERKRIRFRKYCLEDFHLLNVLGRGSFGKVSPFSPFLLSVLFSPFLLSVLFLPSIFFVSKRIERVREKTGKRERERKKRRKTREREIFIQSNPIVSDASKTGNPLSLSLMSRVSHKSWAIKNTFCHQTMTDHQFEYRMTSCCSVRTSIFLSINSIFN